MKATTLVLALVLLTVYVGPALAATDTRAATDPGVAARPVFPIQIGGECIGVDPQVIPPIDVYECPH